MSLEARSSSALFKRAEQLKRWEEWEKSSESPVVSDKNRKIKFSSGCVFLAACAAGDKEEVLRLIENGADIDTANVDGLTALHQACIDDNLDMVEFLVEHGADVNRGDNEGWTPLHATASCGFISIAKYLIEHGADVAAVNNDGELPVDISESDEMEDMLQQHIDDRGIDCEDARNEEERLMLNDAKDWLSSGEIQDRPHPKTGATALHVAAAKGYMKVMEVLVQAGVDVNAQDFDGWTPLHAAAHWGQREACEILVENFCDMDMKNYVGQTAFDVADTDMVRTLEELKKKQSAMQRDKGDINALFNKKSQPKRRSSVTRMSGMEKTNMPKEAWERDRQGLADDVSEPPAIDTVPQVELQIQPELPSPHTENSRVEKKNRANKDEPPRITPLELTKPVPATAPTLQPKQSIVENDDSVPSWRRPGSFRNRSGDTSNKNLTLRIGEKENQTVKVTSPTGPATRSVADQTQEVVLRRTQSFEADEKRGLNREEVKPVNPSGLPQPYHVTTTVATTTTVTNATVTTSPVSTNTTSVTTPPPVSPNPQHTNVRRSFVPPVRDEESETQRKAHAKRVRETRRSTQGVTLEEIKSAEQLVKRKQQQQLHQATQQLNNNEAFMLEDARATPAPVETNRQSETVRRTTPVTTSHPPPSSSVIDTADTTVTIALRRQNRAPDEQDKENDIRNVQASQAVIQRRRRPKRRSTGVVHVDMDEIDPEKQDTGKESENEDMNSSESSGDKSGRSSRLSSTGSADAVENGEIDYKKLYEESKLENERLREKLRRTEEDLNEARNMADKSIISGKGSMSEIEKRERRAMERKLSEMEEELKQLEQLKCENQRLKDENGALIRVISKLSK